MASVRITGSVERVQLNQPFRLSTFGNFALCAPNGSIVTGLSRKARGLIAFLALSSRSASRDALAGLLWSDRGADQARASLRQACYELRHALPEHDALLKVCRDDVALEPGRLWTDIEVLGGLRGDPVGLAAALDPAQRLLLRDLDMLSPAFDDWLTVERVRRVNERRELVIGAARCAIAAGKWGEARHLANAYLGVEPTDPEAAQIAMRAAADACDADDARRIYARHCDGLRRELDAAPSAATMAVLSELVGILPESRLTSAWPTVEVERNAFVPDPSAPLGNLSAMATNAPHCRRPASLTRKRAMIASLAIVGLALIGGVQFLLRSPATAAVTLVRVEPLVAITNDEEGHAVASGLSAAVERHLVGSETPVRIIDGATSDDRSVRIVIRGNSMNDHGTLRANVELVSRSTGQVIWAGKFSRPMSELDQFEDQLGLQIARELNCAYAHGRGPYFERDSEVARLSLAHCDALGTNFEEAVRYDEQIVSRAPGFGRGWAEYAVDTSIVGARLPPALRAAAYSRARAYARRAVSISPHEGLAYAAMMQTEELPTNWFPRERFAANGLEMEPGSPELHAWHAYDLEVIGRLQDALGEYDTAFAHDHFLQGKVSALIEAETRLGNLRRARYYIALGRQFWVNHDWIEGDALQLESMTGGNPAEALRLLNKRSDKDDPDWICFRAYLLWRIAPSQTTLAAAVHTIETVHTLGVRPIQVKLLGMMGQLNSAYRLSDRLSVSDSSDPDWFVPDLAKFRADPRFMVFATRAGLARIWLYSGKWPDFCSQEKLQYDCKAAAQAGAK